MTSWKLAKLIVSLSIFIVACLGCAFQFPNWDLILFVLAIIYMIMLTWDLFTDDYQ